MKTATHQNTGKHGDWRLAGGDTASVDKRIRARLSAGEAIPKIAVDVGVAEGYVRAIATEGDEPAPRPVIELPVVESPTALAQVHCVVAGGEIGARDCLERQYADKCFCPKASFAINAVAPTVLPGTRLEDRLNSCRAFARSVLHADEKYFGPARDARDGKPVEPKPLIAGELPAPPAAKNTSTEGAAMPTAPGKPAQPAAPRVTFPPRAEPAGLPNQNTKEEVMPKGSPLDAVSVDQLRADYALMSVKNIAKKYGCSASTVLARFQRERIETRPMGHKLGTKPAVPRTRPPNGTPVLPPVDPPAPAQQHAPDLDAEIATMRRILADYRALSNPARLYVSGKLTELSRS